MKINHVYCLHKIIFYKYKPKIDGIKPTYRRQISQNFHILTGFPIGMQESCWILAVCTISILSVLNSIAYTTFKFSNLIGQKAFISLTTVLTIYNSNDRFINALVLIQCFSIVITGTIVITYITIVRCLNLWATNDAFINKLIIKICCSLTATVEVFC